MKTTYLLSTLLLLGICSAPSADPSHMKPYVGSVEFEQIKKLAGTWEGSHEMGGETHPAIVTYKVSSAGSSVIETHFPGTPMEMVSVYHDNDGKLAMTHYCAFGNQPELSLKSSSKNRISLAFAGGANVDPAVDQHMNSLDVEIQDSDNMVQHWTMHKDGKAAGTSQMALHRVKKQGP